MLGPIGPIFHYQNRNQTEHSGDQANEEPRHGSAAAGLRGKGGYHGEAQPDRDQHSHIDVTLEKVAVRGRYHGADATRAFSVIRTGRTPA